MATWCFHSGGVCWEVSKAFPECCCAGCRELLFLPYSTCSFRAGSKSLSRRAAKIKKSVFPKPLVRRLALPQKSKRAPTARDIKARGKREAKRSASPLGSTPTKGLGLKGRNTDRIRPFRAGSEFYSLPGATRFALAPGFYISRPWRCVATFGAKPLEMIKLKSVA